MSANIKASTDGTQAIIGVGGVDQMTVSNAGVVTANSFVGAISGNMSGSTAIATGSTTARTLANRFADVVNVKDFGAVGDGVADDTAAIQAAINSTSPFGSVFFPESTYKISSTITLPSSSGYNGLTLFGVGWGSIIKPTSAVSIAFQALGDVVFIEKLQFDGVLTTGAAALRFDGGLNNNTISVSNCYFSTFTTAIILFTDSYTIKENNFTNCNLSIHCADSAMNATICNNYVLGGNKAILFGLITQQAEGVRVFSNTFLCTGASANQIEINAGLEISIFNNIIDQTGTNGKAIYISGVTGSSISHIKIRDNWLCGGATSAGQCVQVEQGSGNNTNNIWIEGNTFTSTTPATYALTINTVSNYWVLNNHFYGTGLTNFTGTPFVVVGSNNGNIFGNKNLSTSLPVLENNTLNKSLISNGLIQATSFNNSGLTWTTGSGSPEGNVTAAVGSIYSNGGGLTPTTVFYVKTSGSGNTGWTAK
jgi:hypothetical protein